MVVFRLWKGVSRAVSKLGSKIRLQTAFMLARDLQAYRAGDVARFDRMVDGHGKGLISHNKAIENIEAICREVEANYPVTSRLLLKWVGQ